ncbi:MAG: PaaX family transcriptional regulator C-terminal domain-containing protein [Actinomycetota bacterium]
MKLNGNTLSGERPLTARSVIASTLLGARPPVLASHVLVRSGELFGVGEGTTRVALSRMVAAGELEASDGSYALAGHLLERMTRQDESRRPVLRTWTGDWLVGIVTAASRTAAQRAGLRSAMRALRLAELREGVWMRPDNLDAADLPHARTVADEQCTWFRARPEVLDDIPGEMSDRRLAATLWDLGGWLTRGNELRRRMSTQTGRLERGRKDALAAGFLLAAAVLRHMQSDPLLPPELLGDDWPGRALRDEFDAFERAFGLRWREWLVAPSHVALHR